MDEIKLSKIDGNICIIENIIEINEKNYWNLIKLEKELTEKGIKYIHIILPIQDKKNIDFLLNNGYFFKERIGNKYILEKECFRVKSWRISLTENCNYACFFCHEEGLDMTKKRDKEKSKEEIYELIKFGITNHYTDITFTGGEPLLKWKDIIYYLDKLEDEKLTPDITIVTNGVCITDELLDRIKLYKGKVKFNFSMHSLTKETYLSIVNAKDKNENNFEKVIENIKKIREKGIEIKLNFVLLKGINTTKEEIKKILDFSYENDINCIKFLELLITDKLISLYKYYYQLNSLYKDWENEFELIGKEPRREVYKYKNKIKIELQLCTCAAGCTNCLLNRDINITAELKYYPCFILSNENYLVNSKNLLSEIEKGNNMIVNFGKKYKNDSPLLIKNKKYITSKKEFYYTTNLNLTIDEIITILEKLGYEKNEKRDFEEIYYKPINSNEKWDNFEIVYKVFLNTYVQEYIETIQEIKIEKTENKDTAVKVTFLNMLLDNNPKKIKNLTEYETFLNKLDYKSFLKLNWEILILNKGKKNISIGYNKEYNKISFMSKEETIDDDVRKKFNLISLNTTVQKFLLND